MRYVSLQEVIFATFPFIAHRRGSYGFKRSWHFGIGCCATGGLFGGEELYPDLASKGAAYAADLVSLKLRGHPVPTV
jgi:hypothetical protein